MKCSLGISNFLEEISSLSHSIVFLYFLALIAEEGFLISLLAILWNSAFKWVYFSFPPLIFASLLFTVICKASQTAILLFCISFSWGWSWFLSPVQRQLYIGDNCTVPCTWQLRQFKMVCQTQEWAILFLSKATILGEKTDIKLRTSEKFNVCVCV